MCLAVPGEILSICNEDTLPQALVSFAGIKKTVCTVYTAEATVGDFVLVHAGFSISVIDQNEARTLIAAYEGKGLEAKS